MILATTTRQISLYGLRGVRVGEASHPGPPKSLLRRQLLDHTSRNVAARISVSPSPRATLFDVDVPSSIPPTVPASSGAVAHVEVAQGDSGRVRVADVVAEVVSRRVRRVSSDSDVPVVTRGNRFAVLSESDNESDNEPSDRAEEKRGRRDHNHLVQLPHSHCPLVVMSTTGWEATEVLVSPTFVPRRWTSRTQPFPQMEVCRIWSGTMRRRHQWRCSPCRSVPTQSHVERHSSRARSGRRLRLVWDDPQSDVHDGRAEMGVVATRSTVTTRDLSGSVDRCNAREEKFTQLPNSSGQWPHEWGLLTKVALCPDSCDINSGPRSMCL